MIIIGMISVVIYIVAILMIFTNTYEFEKSKKIGFIVMGIVISAIITVIVCQISSNDIQASQSYINITKKVAIWLFSPINAILFLPYIGNILNKYKSERISKEQLIKKIILVFAIGIVVIIFEIGYMKDFEMGLIKSVIHR